IAERTRIVVVGALEEVRDVRGGWRAGVDDAGRSVGRRSVRVVALVGLAADEEEHLVLPDRPAEASTVLRLIELADLRPERSLPDVGWIALGSEDRAFEVVRSRAGDGVDAAAGEAALADVVRRDEDLDLLNGVERDRLRAGAAARSARAGEAEQIVVDRAVDL